ncbi:probable 1-deoxy-D-xylulose-5-phosphate synthase, chloroplastic isoform X1 [Lycium barbarum]|uniref:probable 1-deoxy-D-xylulose-5-phosphate synthase, chloroplastic isoform X1 n=1 Tax=Lycium barbarum TaxID=112863 RepID=UPI00293F21EA|nr:probable 1-deoxy-D-xylulose-5-phosphate synthase, chloroplastic isoform X1 [Lycium barbarum]
MVAVSAQYPCGICPHFNGNSKILSPETELCSLSFPSRVGYSRLNLSLKDHVAQVHSLPHAGDFTGENEPTPVLDAIESPMNLKNLSTKELNQLADEVRSELSFIMAKAQRPSRSSLAVVELSVAIHHVFHAPVDKILWDVAEQTYAHKLLTGRRQVMQTLGEPTPDFESEFDPFKAGHGCNSISAGLGMAVARDFKGKRDRVVAVINNETTMAGQVYEAMSNAGYLDSNMIVILNDSQHSLHPKLEEASKTPINALSKTLSKLQSSKLFRRFRELAKVLTKKIGKGMYEWAAKVDEYARGMIGPPGSTLFEELGLYYIGPVDGHNIEDLVSVLNEVASLDSMGPVLVHVITKEELQVADNQMNANKIMEGASSSDTIPCGTRTYSDCFVEALISAAERHKDIVAVHAGMGMEPSLHLLKNVFAEKFFDVGMAEQHAVTFAAGLARGGLKPFCIIPSAFLQRAYDQVIHDVDRQKVPVRFIITSAGLVGSDGPTQCGAFDIAFMSCLPNMIVMAPSDEVELSHMVATAALIDDRPVCFRYPRGALSVMEQSFGSGIPIEEQVGKGRILREGKDIALLGYGSMVQNCLRAQSLLSKLGVEVTVADARFCKPLDIKLLQDLCKSHSFLVTVEEGSIGGFASHVAQFLSLNGQLDAGIKWRPITLPDNYIEQASPKEQLAVAGLTGNHIAATALSLLGRTREALLLMC